MDGAIAQKARVSRLFCRAVLTTPNHRSFTMINLHTVEKALLTFSFSRPTIRHATKCVDEHNQTHVPHYIPVVSGNVKLSHAPSGDCYLTVQQIGDTGELEDVIVYIPANGDSEAYICSRQIVGRCGL